MPSLARRAAVRHGESIAKHVPPRAGRNTAARWATSECPPICASDVVAEREARDHWCSEMCWGLPARREERGQRVNHVFARDASVDGRGQALADICVYYH